MKGEEKLLFKKKSFLKAVFMAKYNLQTKSLILSFSQRTLSTLLKFSATMHVLIFNSEVVFLSNFLTFLDINHCKMSLLLRTYKWTSKNTVFSVKYSVYLQ